MTGRTAAAIITVLLLGFTAAVLTVHPDPPRTPLLITREH